MLRVDADDGRAEALMAALLLVLVAEEVEGEDRERQVNHVVELASHLPGRQLTGIRLRLEVIGATVQPVLVAVRVQLIEVLELIERVMLQVVGLYSDEEIKVLVNNFMIGAY